MTAGAEAVCADAVSAEAPQAEFIDVIYPDLTGQIRGKRLPSSEADRMRKGGMCFPGSVFLLDVRGENHDPCGRGFSDGDPDCYGRVIPATCRPVPWLAHRTEQIMVSFDNADGTPYPFDPRNVLARCVERLRMAGIIPVVAFELEFFLIDEERDASGGPKPPPIYGPQGPANQLQSLDDLDRIASLVSAIRAAASVQGLPVDTISSEYGPGQYEVNLRHSADALAAADHCILLRRLIRGVCGAQGLGCTFMAKPYMDQPGSGMHVHLSLLDQQGNGVFDGDCGPSENLGHAIGGLLEGWPESMALFAPNRNSYRRFLPGGFVPVRRGWGVDNRSVAVRVPQTRSNEWRLEHRVAGADANPYLVLAAILAAAEYGLNHRCEPGPETNGGGRSGRDPSLPFTLPNALDMITKGPVLRDAIGDQYLRTYCAAKLAEFEKFERLIQPAEYEWYL